MMPPVLYPASARPTVTPATTRAAHVLPEIDADAIAELAPPPSLPEGTLEPWVTPLRELLADGTVNPVIAGTFSFEEAGAGQTMIVERRNVGKVVLTP